MGAVTAADPAATGEPTDESAAVVSGMTDLLVKAVRALGAAGEPEQASRLAGKAWWVLKDWPRQAERVNGTMHYLARLEQRGAEGSPTPTEQ
jgi:hypothetical protein